MKVFPVHAERHTGTESAHRFGYFLHVTPWYLSGISLVGPCVARRSNGRYTAFPRSQHGGISSLSPDVFW